MTQAEAQLGLYTQQIMKAYYSRPIVELPQIKPEIQPTLNDFLVIN